MGHPVEVDGGCNCYGKPRQYYANNRWTPQTPNSRFPRVWTGSSPNALLSDVWLSDASYFRISMVQLGYTIPQIGNSIHDLRIYVSAEDPFIFTDWEGLYPAGTASGVGYPRMSTFSVGLEVSFY